MGAADLPPAWLGSLCPLLLEDEPEPDHDCGVAGGFWTEPRNSGGTGLLPAEGMSGVNVDFVCGRAGWLGPLAGLLFDGVDDEDEE